MSKGKAQQITFDEFRMGFDNLLYLFFDYKPWVGIYSYEMNSIGLCVAGAFNYCVPFAEKHLASAWNTKTIQHLISTIEHENLHKALLPAIHGEMGKEETKEFHSVDECCVATLMGYSNEHICGCCGYGNHSFHCEHCEQEMTDNYYSQREKEEKVQLKKERENRIKKVHLNKLVVWGVLMADRRGRVKE